MYYDENIVQDYGFLSCRNELLSLAIVITYYDNTEICGIRINNTRVARNFTRLCFMKIFSLHSCN